MKGSVIGIDASTMEANASLKTLVRKETKENYNTYLEKLAMEAGIETPTKEDLARFDKKRKGKKMSNDDWDHPHDPDSKIAKMKDGTSAYRTHITSIFCSSNVIFLEI